MDKYQRIIRSIEELSDTCRYTAAYNSYLDLQKNLADPSVDDEVRSILGDQLENNDEIKLAIQRALEVEETLRETVKITGEGTESGWIHGATMHGITTYYRPCENNEITVRIEGTQEDLPLFEQLAVLHEIDLYKEWVPFCRESITIDKRGKAELFPYINVGIPPFTRDWLVQAYGADCTLEEGKILIIGNSIDDYHGDPSKKVPFQAEGWTHARLIVKEFKAIIEILSPQSAKSTIIAHVDLKASLPQAVINFAIKNLAGYMLYFMQRQVKKVTEDHNCQHAQRIRSDTGFYRDWLLQKVRNYCDYRGWEQPFISVLGDDGIPPERDHIGSSKELANEGKEVTPDDTQESHQVVSVAAVGDSTIVDDSSIKVAIHEPVPA